MRNTCKRLFLATILFILTTPSFFLHAMEISSLSPQKSAEIQHISMKDKSDLDKNGFMSVKFLSRLLKTAYQEKTARYRSFQNPAILTIKKLAEQEKEAPWGATQIFSIQTPGQAYILKGIKHKEEIENLIKSVNIPQLAGFVYPKKIVTFPQFLFPVAYFSYTDQHNNKHYLSLMPTAPGVSLSDLMKKFAYNPEKNSLAIASAYFDVGAAMANFYQKTDRKIAHGDLHHGNIFYDAASHRVTLIDNERVAASSKKADQCEESAFLLMKSLFVVKWTNPELFSALKLEAWYSLVIPSYILGYLSAYPQTERKKIYEWLVDCIINYRSPENNLRWYNDTTVLGFSHQHYIAPLLKKLATSDILLAVDRNSINNADKNGKTFLHKAANKGEWHLITPLLALGADIDARDNNQNTPLHEAAYYNHPHAVEVLIKSGAALNAQDINGESPLDKALSNTSNEAIKILQKYGASKGKKMPQRADIFHSLRELEVSLESLKKMLAS